MDEILKDLKAWEQHVGLQSANDLNLQITGTHQSLIDGEVAGGELSGSELLQAPGSQGAQGAQGETQGSEGAGSGQSSNILSPVSNGSTSSASREAVGLDGLTVNANSNQSSVTNIIIRPADSAGSSVSQAVREIHEVMMKERMSKINMREQDFKVKY
jgi:hypothetical protein